MHHTLEEDEMQTAQLNKLGKAIRYFFNKLISRSLKNATFGVGAVTRQILTHEAKKFNVPKSRQFLNLNGVDFDQINAVEDERSGVIKLTILATHFYTWHGLLEILTAFVASDLEYQLNIVGSVDPTILSDDRFSDPRITFTGFLASSEYRKILAKTDLALGSFALHKKGLTHATSLKVREYLASGIPVCSGHLDDAFEGVDFPFYHYFPEVDVDKMLDLALYFRKFSREEVRMAAYPYIDKAKCLSNFQAQLLAAYESANQLSGTAVTD